MLGRQCLSAYVISMATRASDVLAVELLQREARLMVLHEGHTHRAGRRSNPSPPLRVVPLFETLSDLEASHGVMERLFKCVSAVPVWGSCARGLGVGALSL